MLIKLLASLAIIASSAPAMASDRPGWKVDWKNDCSLSSTTNNGSLMNIFITDDDIAHIVFASERWSFPANLQSRGWSMRFDDKPASGEMFGELLVNRRNLSIIDFKIQAHALPGFLDGLAKSNTIRLYKDEQVVSSISLAGAARSVTEFNNCRVMATR